MDSREIGRDYSIKSPELSLILQAEETLGTLISREAPWWP